MTGEQALALHRELEELANFGPGTGIRPAERDRRLQRIRLAFQHDPSVDSYLREKVRIACSDLEIWLSERRWQRWGADRYRGLLNIALYNMYQAINATFRGAESAER